MNAEQRQRVSDAVEREHPWPGDDEIAGHPFAADSEEPTHEVVAIVSAPASLAERLAAVERVHALADALGLADYRVGASDDFTGPLVDARNAARAALHDAIDALAGITPAERARAEGR